MDFLKTFTSDPRYTVLAVLLITLIYNFATSTSALSFLAPLLATVAFGAVLELGLWHFVEKRPLAVPLSAIITSTIISIVLTPSFATIHFSFLAVLIALLSKHFLKMGFSHVFNPANIGALAVSLLQSTMQSWWATGTPWLAALLGLVVIYRIRAWFITLPFLLVTIILQGALMFYTGQNNVDFLFASIFSGTVLFFATVMLVEPMTTPTNDKSKLAFGLIAALLNFGFSFVLPEVSFLAALAICNVLVPHLDNIFTNQPPAPSVPTPTAQPSMASNV